MNDKKEEHFVNTARRFLDESVEHLDASILSKLSRARNTALDGGMGRKSLFRRPWPMVGMTASAMAGAVLVLFILSVGPFRPETVETNLTADLGLLTSEEPIEFLEDIEFYEWFSTGDGGQEDISRLHGSLFPPAPAATGALSGSRISG